MEKLLIVNEVLQWSRLLVLLLWLALGRLVTMARFKMISQVLTELIDGKADKPDFSRAAPKITKPTSGSRSSG